MQTLNKKKARFIVLSLIIPLTLLICFVVFPAGDLIRMSFTNWDGYSSSSDFIGFDNYISMFQNKDLWTSLRNNGVYFAAHLLFIPIELMVAVMLTSKMRAAKAYKTIVFLPYIINGVAIAYAFSYFFSPVNGAFNSMLEFAHLEGFIRNWLSDEKIVNVVWHLYLRGVSAAIILFYSWLHCSPYQMKLWKLRQWMGQIPGIYSVIFRCHPFS